MNILRKIREVDRALNEGHISYQEAADVLAKFTDAEPIRHGHWIEHEWAEEVEGQLISNFECSECNGWERKTSSYCPNCGAKMDGE